MQRKGEGQAVSQWCHFRSGRWQIVRGTWATSSSCPWFRPTTIRVWPTVKCRPSRRWCMLRSSSRCCAPSAVWRTAPRRLKLRSHIMPSTVKMYRWTTISRDIISTDQLDVAIRVKLFPYFVSFFCITLLSRLKTWSTYRNSYKVLETKLIDLVAKKYPF